MLLKGGSKKGRRGIRDRPSFGSSKTSLPCSSPPGDCPYTNNIQIILLLVTENYTYTNLKTTQICNR